jgi:two-component system, NarL family, response regulator NreC
MGRTRILIADDHEIFRKGLRWLVESHAELEICGEAANGVEAVEMAKKLAPDVIIMDISMPYVNGLDATRQIRQQVPNSRILILSQHDSSHMLTAAFNAGASGYVTKSQVAHYLLSALDAVMQGQPFGWTSEGFVSQARPAEAELKKQSE